MLAARINLGGEALRRECSKCHQLKHPREFYRWRHSQCKACVRGPSAKRQAAWRAANLEECRRRDRAFEFLHRETRREKNRIWRQNNPEKAKASADSWRDRNREWIAERTKGWSAANREHINAWRREWVKKNPTAARLLEARIRAKRAAAPGVCSTEQLRARVEFYGNKCAYCDGPYESIDHVIPLSRGGSNWPANLRPACSVCNTKKKGTKTLGEWKR